MTKAEINEIVVNKLRKIAPEVDFDALPETENLREELDIDSIDWLNFLVTLDEELGIAIPESDYEQLDTLEHLIDYLCRSLIKV